MSSGAPLKTPALLALLSDPEALKYLTSPVLHGEEELPQESIERSCQELDDDHRWDADPIRDLIEEAMNRFADAPTDSDAWLAPRLHSAMRLTRREAAETGRWNFLTLRLAPDYVLWRFSRSANGATAATNRQRFCGPSHTQGFARLWWSAELFRNGDDYHTVEIACANQEVFHTLLHSDAVNHRATALAIVAMLDRGIVGNTRELIALSRMINATASTLSYEVLAPVEPSDVDAYKEWTMKSGETYVPYDSLPEGPDDGKVSPSSIKVLVTLFENIFEEAPIRGRVQSGLE